MATASVTNSFTNGTTADATEVNTNFSDLVTFLNNSVVHRDGSKAMTAALPMGSNKITGLTKGAASGEAADFIQADHFTVVFTQSGDLAVGTGAVRWYAPFACTVVSAHANVGTAPTGATAIFDVNRNGTTIYTTQTNRPTVAISGFYDEGGTPDGTVALTAGTDYLTIDIDQVGSTVAGADAVVTVHLRRT